MRRYLYLPLCAASAMAQQSAMDPAGRQARSIAMLGGFFLALLGVIFIAVVAILLWTLTRRRAGTEQTASASAASDRRLAAVVSTATIVSVLVLFGLVAISVSAGNSIAGPRNQANSLTIEITGNQWWWYARYANDDASRAIVTANEIHIPVGRPVQIRGTSNDVIHSFWVPSLHGKRDLIPSRVTTEWLEAERPGIFRGQCAEFCGLQHAHMALWVIADTADQFAKWSEHQLQPAVAPSDPARQRGQEVFLNSGCVLCHTVQGTPAAGQVGPDLTHFASRLMLAAGTLLNNRGNLAGWIADPQGIKPGNHMATLPLQSQDMHALLDYLESLR
jgi:cytochrome c oxidase subunit 2